MKFIKALIILISLSVNNLNAQTFKPYILAATSDESLTEISDIVKTNMTESGLEIIKEYSPVNDSNRMTFVITSVELKDALKGYTQ